jgi:hypothetical protein
MRKFVAACVIPSFLAVPAVAQPKKGTTVAYDLTVTAEGKPYTGTMVLTIAGGTVTGTMNITTPTAVTGTPAGTAKAGRLKLEFPYKMAERACEGQIAMEIPLPKKDAGPATGTALIAGCGRAPDNKLAATVELKLKKT